MQSKRGLIMMEQTVNVGKNISRLFELVAELDDDGNVCEEIVSRGDLR